MKNFKTIFNNTMQEIYNIKHNINFTDIILTPLANKNIETGLFGYIDSSICNFTIQSEYLSDSFQRTNNSFTLRVYDTEDLSLMHFSSLEKFKEELADIVLKYENTKDSIFNKIKPIRELSRYNNINIIFDRRLTLSVVVTSDSIKLSDTFYDRYTTETPSTSLNAMYTKLINLALDNFETLRAYASTRSFSLRLTSRQIRQLRIHDKNYILLSSTIQDTITAILDTSTKQRVNDKELEEAILAKLALLS